jgi:hypothetical protein
MINPEPELDRWVGRVYGSPLYHALSRMLFSRELSLNPMREVGEKLRSGKSVDDLSDQCRAFGDVCQQSYPWVGGVSNADIVDKNIDSINGSNIGVELIKKIKSLSSPAEIEEQSDAEEPEEE